MKKEKKVSKNEVEFMEDRPFFFSLGGSKEGARV